MSSLEEEELINILPKDGPSLEEIKKIQIDPSTRLADVNLENNIWTVNTVQELTAPEIIFKSKL